MIGRMSERVHQQRWGWLSAAVRPTRWSLVRRARQRSSDSGQLAADELCRAYWYPLYTFLRSSGYPQADAEDYVQTFLVRLLDEDWLEEADPSRGRLWNFLLKLLTRHIAARRVRESARKRGGGAVSIPIDWSTAEALYLEHGLGGVSPEDSFRRALATRLVADGIEILRKRYAETGKEALFEELLPALEGTLEDGTYADVGERVGMKAAAVRAAAVRFRERFRLCVKERASKILNMPDGPRLDDELHRLFCTTSPPNTV